MGITTQLEATFFALTSKAFGSITGSHTSLKAAGDIVKIITYYNGTNQDLIISCDGGVTDSTILPAGSSQTYDFAANSFHDTSGIFVKHNGVAPTTGSVYCFGVKEA
jgi:hypothetical protein